MFEKPWSMYFVLHESYFIRIYQKGKTFEFLTIKYTALLK